MDNKVLPNQRNSLALDYNLHAMDRTSFLSFIKYLGDEKEAQRKYLHPIMSVIMVFIKEKTKQLQDTAKHSRTKVPRYPTTLVGINLKSRNPLQQ